MKVSDEPGLVADTIDGTVGGAVGGAMILIIVVICITAFYIRQSCKKRINANKQQVMKSMNISSNCMTDQDGNVHEQEDSDICNDTYDTVTMDANPSYGIAIELDAIAHCITTVPVSNVAIQPNPSYSSDSDQDQYCYVETNEIQHHHSVRSPERTSYLKVISSSTTTDDSVNDMATD